MPPQNRLQSGTRLPQRRNPDRPTGQGFPPIGGSLTGAGQRGNVLTFNPSVPDFGPGGQENQPFPNISSGDVPIDIQQLNPVVFGGLEQLRRQGIFGEKGIARFQQLSERASAERRRKIGIGLRRSFGRRGLRGRSGAVTTALANASRGENEALTRSLQQIFTLNEQSKLGGLGGLRDLLVERGRTQLSDKEIQLGRDISEDSGVGFTDLLPLLFLL